MGSFGAEKLRRVILRAVSQHKTCETRMSVCPAHFKTLDRLCLQSKRGAAWSFCCPAAASRLRFFGHGRLGSSPLGRKTTALQNQGDQLNLSQFAFDTSTPQHVQTLLFSTNGRTEAGANE